MLILPPRYTSSLHSRNLTCSCDGQLLSSTLCARLAREPVTLPSVLRPASVTLQQQVIVAELKDSPKTVPLTIKRHQSRPQSNTQTIVMGSPSEHLPPNIFGGATYQSSSRGYRAASSYNRWPSRSGDRMPLHLHDHSTAQHNPCGHIELVLRVSGRHLLVVETRNKVTVMAWLSKDTTRPTGCYSGIFPGTTQPATMFFLLLSRIKGVTFCEIHDKLDDGQIGQILGRSTSSPSYRPVHGNV